MSKYTMNVDELAKAMGLSKPVAYALTKQKEFPKIQVGKRIVIPVASFEAWLAKEAGKEAAVR